MLAMACACGCGAVLDAGSDWVAAHLVDGDPSAGWAAMCRSGNERMKRELRVRLRYPTPDALLAGIAPRDLKKQLALSL